MNISYKRKHNESFMIINEPMEAVNHELKMIERNTIKALLEKSEMEIDGQSKHLYNISKRESLADFVENNTMDEKAIERFLLNMQLSLEELAGYLIDSNNLYISPETVFIDKSRDEYRIKLCYFPTGQSFQESFRGILEYFLEHIKADDRELMEKLCQIYDLAQREDFTLLELREALSQVNENKEIYVEQIDLTEDKEEESTPEKVLDRDYLADFYEDEETDLMTYLKTFLKNLFAKKDKKKNSFVEPSGDFLVEQNIVKSEPTILLSDASKSSIGKLIYDGNKIEDNFIIGSDVFKIGTDKATNHGIINSKSVSRNHARITKEDNCYYIEDLNSTNGTLLNGRELSYKEKVALKPLDSIMFADVSYVFM